MHRALASPSILLRPSSFVRRSSVTSSVSRTIVSGRHPLFLRGKPSSFISDAPARSSTFSSSFRSGVAVNSGAGGIIYVDEVGEGDGDGDGDGDDASVKKNKKKHQSKKMSDDLDSSRSRVVGEVGERASSSVHSHASPPRQHAFKPPS